MPDPLASAWWEDFLLVHGRSTPMDKAFTGYLAQHNIAPYDSVDALVEAYAAFQDYVVASGWERPADVRPVEEPSASAVGAPPPPDVSGEAHEAIPEPEVPVPPSAAKKRSAHRE